MEQASVHFRAGEWRLGLGFFFHSIALKGYGFFLVLFIVILYLSKFFLQRKTPPAILPSVVSHAPKPDIAHLPFQKRRVGSIEEFVGQEKAMDWLKTHLIDRPTNSVAVVSLYGVGGMGKTFLAHVFTAEHREDHRFLEVYVGKRPAFNAGLELLTKLKMDIKKVLGNAYVPDWEADYKKLADDLSHRPYGIRLAAESMKTLLTLNSPRNLIDQLKARGLTSPRKDFPEDQRTLASLRPLLEHCLNQLETKSGFARELLDYLAVCSDEGIEVRHFLEWQSGEVSQEQVEHELIQAQDLGLLLVEETRLDIADGKQREKKIRLHTDLLNLLLESPLSTQKDAFQRYLHQTLVVSPEDLESKRTFQKQIIDLHARYRNDPKILKSLYALSENVACHLPLIQNIRQLLITDPCILHAVHRVLVPQLALDSGHITGFLNDMLAHGVPGRVGRLALDMGQLANFTPDRTDRAGA
jgi:hypothetical protein